MAVLRQNEQLVQALVDWGFGVMKQNSRGWLALDEAVSLRNRNLVSLFVSKLCVHCSQKVGQGRALRSTPRPPVALTPGSSPSCPQLQVAMHVLQAELLYFAMVDSMKAAVKARRSDLLASMRDMPDHNLSVRIVCYMCLGLDSRKPLAALTESFCKRRARYSAGAR